MKEMMQMNIVIVIAVIVIAVVYGFYPKKETKILSCQYNLSMIVSESFSLYSCAVEILTESSIIYKIT